MESFVCSTCGVQFPLVAKLEKHIARSHDERMFQCNHCDKEIKGKLSLKNHLDSHKTFECKLCGLVISKNSRGKHKAKCQMQSNKVFHQCDQVTQVIC